VTWSNFICEFSLVAPNDAMSFAQELRSGLLLVNAKTLEALAEFTPACSESFFAIEQASSRNVPDEIATRNSGSASFFLPC
jgi:hypothetical protein